MSMLDTITAKVKTGAALSREEALHLLNDTDLLELGQLADWVRQHKHPHGRVTFVVDRNVNYTNVCVSECKFCAFYRKPEATDTYVLPLETIYDKIQELVDHGGTQLLMQGGIHPDLGLDWFENLFRQIKRRFPRVQVHSLSPAEVTFLAEKEKISIAACIERLRKSGLDSIPGGGAEVLVDRVRELISPNKIGWRQWADVMEEAHRQGMRATATLMFGTEETPDEIVEHLFRVREIQEKTGGFTAFIGWTFQPGNTELGGDPATGVEYLRVLALSRIVLDNIDNVQASWVTQGKMMAQVALRFGANDLGGTMLEENVVAAAGVDFRMSQDEIIEIARGAGFTPAKRTTLYDILEEY